MNRNIFIIFIVFILILNLGIFNAIGTTYIKKSYKNQYEEGKNFAVIYVGRYFPKLDFNKSHWGPKGGWRNLETIQQYYKWYLNDAGKMYKMLNETYGYDEENIILLVNKLPTNIKVPLNETDENGGEIWKTFFEIPENFDPQLIDNEYDSDELGFKNVLKDFKNSGKNQLSSKDTLFICFIDHGGEIKNEDFSKNT